MCGDNEYFGLVVKMNKSMDVRKQLVSIQVHTALTVNKMITSCLKNRTHRTEQFHRWHQSIAIQ